MIKFICHLYLKAIGWRLIGDKPTEPQYVFIAAPHTSNWDLMLMLTFAGILKLKISWFGKKSLFEKPWGGLLKRLGGLSIDRAQRGNTVQQMAAAFTEREDLVLAVPPSGTRSKRDYWKSGFYHIAATAQVPIYLGYLDYGKKEGGLGMKLVPSGDLMADMDAIRAFYADKKGRYPEKQSRIHLREEDPHEEAAEAPESQSSNDASSTQDAPQSAG